MYLLKHRIGENSSATVCYQPPLVETDVLQPAQHSSSESSASASSSKSRSTRPTRHTSGPSTKNSTKDDSGGPDHPPTSDPPTKNFSKEVSIGPHPPTSDPEPPPAKTHPRSAVRPTLRSARHTTIADRLPPNSFYRDPPNLYVFPGAEIWWDDNSTTSTDSSSSSASSSSASSPSSTPSADRVEPVECDGNTAEEAAVIERRLLHEEEEEELVVMEVEQKKTDASASRKRQHLPGAGEEIDSDKRMKLNPPASTENLSSPNDGQAATVVADGRVSPADHLVVI